MANTTIDQLSSLTGVNAANNDIFMLYDASADIEKQISVSEIRNMVVNAPLTGPISITGTLSATGNITGGGQIVGKYTLLANGTTAMSLSTNAVAKVTPSATATYTTTVAPAGSRASIVILTSGTTSYTITFGTGFITTGTLATGVLSGKYFVINFVSDGSSMIETGRTAAM